MILLQDQNIFIIFINDIENISDEADGTS